MAINKKFRTLLDFLISIIELPASYLFGRDVFISYARSDAGMYAPNLALALQAKRKKISFYLDKWIAPASSELPASLRLQLRLSSMLVIICTPGAVKSTFVRDEIRIFSRKRRKVIVVDVDGNFVELKQEADIWDAVGGTSPEKESWDAIKSGQPSDHVLDRILKSVEFTTQDNRLKRAVWATVAFLLISIGGGLWYSLNARAEALKQREIGVIRSISNQSMRTLEQNSDSIFSSTLLGIEAARRSDSIGEHILESDLALRSSLKFLPRLISKNEIVDAEIFSADLNYAAILTQKKDSTLLTVKKTSKDSIIATIPLADRVLPFGLSNDAGRIGIIDKTSDGTLFRIIEINGKRHWDIVLRKEVDIFYKVDLSPDGRYLLLAYCEEGDMDRTMTGYVMNMVAEVWNVEKQEFVTTLDTKGFLQVHVMAFSPEGKYIAIGGMGRGPRGNDIGRALVWQAPTHSAVWTKEDFNAPDELVQTNFINNLAISDDGVWLATFANRSVFTWKKAYRSYRLESSMPAPKSLEWLYFNSNYNLQAIAKENTTGLTISEWEAFGYYGSVSAPHENQIKHFAFEACDSTFLSVTDRHLDENAIFRRWKLYGGSVVKDSSWNARYSTNDSLLPAEPGCEDLSKPFFSGDRTYMGRVGKVNDDTSILIIYTLNKSGYVKMASWKVNATVYVNDIIFRMSEKQVIIVQVYEPVQIWDLKTKKDIAPASMKALEKVSACKLSDNGKFLAVESQMPDEPDEDTIFHDVHVWDLQKLDILKLIRSKTRISAYEFSPGSSYLAVGDRSGRLQIVHTNNLFTKDIYSNFPISSVAFSADEKYVAIGDEGGLVRVNKTDDWSETTQLAYSGIVHGLLFSCNSEYIAVSITAEDSMFSDEFTENYMLYVTPLSLKLLIAEAERRLKVIRSY